MTHGVVLATVCGIGTEFPAAYTTITPFATACSAPNESSYSTISDNTSTLCGARRRGYPCGQDVEFGDMHNGASGNREGDGLMADEVTGREEVLLELGGVDSGVVVVFADDLAGAIGRQGQRRCRPDTRLSTMMLYIVYLGERKHENPEHVTDSHLDMLTCLLGSKKDALNSIVYSYMHGFSGFAAMLREEQAEQLAKSPDVISVQPSRNYELANNTELGFSGTAIIAYDPLVMMPQALDMVATSFHLLPLRWPDPLTGPQEAPPSFSTFHVVIRSAFLLREQQIRLKFPYVSLSRYNAEERRPKATDVIRQNFGTPWAVIVPERLFRVRRRRLRPHQLQPQDHRRTLLHRRNRPRPAREGLPPRDFNGHDTLTASVVAGSIVYGANFHGLAAGVARGGAPRARLAMYKVVWASARGTGATNNAIILAAVDDAIHDGVDVLSLSMVLPQNNSYGVLHAVVKGVMVVYAAGNSGPTPQTVGNTAPSPEVAVDLTHTVVGQGVLSPKVAWFSSRGPALPFPGVLKPDIAAPGVNILGAYRDGYRLTSGTSLPYPHVSGVVALLKTLHPNWSHAAIKPTLVTTESLPLKIVDPFDFGGGQIVPNKASDPGQVYDIDPQEYYKFFKCSEGQLSICDQELAPVYNLNLPAISVPDLIDAKTVGRMVTNIGKADAMYKVSIESPPGVKMIVAPSNLVFDVGAKVQSFKVTFMAIHKLQGNYVFGSLTWSDGEGHAVRITIFSTLFNLTSLSALDLRFQFVPYWPPKSQSSSTISRRFTLRLVYSRCSP
ncbi:hypothetical protein ZIOFF_020474 [Zingiber officinale]|uniref:Uncharacterized protein n=1 Tax=Zingiber officinale TaxID=94328 RepID=A0A8J5H5P8_ZINOF|nr:hypothetical protein ZIOFF_020474 [Zingiber officinale]